jgi:hypothetical protein
MTMATVVSHRVPDRATGLAAWSLPSSVTPAEAGRIVVSFLDAATTSLGRATHYNTREDQQRAERRAHDALLGLDRDLYAVLLGLPGVTDRARQVGLKNLLGSSRAEGARLLDPEVEREILHGLVGALPVPRLLKLFEALRVGSPEEGIRKANNARTRKLVLRTLLGSPRLELWAVKYRSKLLAAFTHVWGKRTASVVRAVLGKPEALRSPKERAIVAGAIDRFVPGHAVGKVRECVAFVLGFRVGLTLPLLTAFMAARIDLSAGAVLPLEVLDGIRSVFHPGAPRGEALRLAAPTLTVTQRMNVQKRAVEAKVDVRFDPADYDAVRLYVYAFEMGMTVEIARALLDKARTAARTFPVRYGTIGILVDASASMMGAGEHKLGPMASALALRDLLQHTSRSRVVYAGGESSGSDAMLVRPQGETGLAEALLDLLSTMPEAIFVVSDGYENRPAGRFAEVVSWLRRIGDTTPIYHLNPVFAAEAQGVRELCPGLVPTLPVSRPEALGIAMLRSMLEADPVRGIPALIRLALPSLTLTKG